LHTIQDGLDQNWSSVCYCHFSFTLLFCFLCWNLVSYRTHVCILELKGETKHSLYIFVVQWVLANGVEGIGKLFFYVTYT
jgi:hypothetical protein